MINLIVRHYTLEDGRAVLRGQVCLNLAISIDGASLPLPGALEEEDHRRAMHDTVLSGLKLPPDSILEFRLHENSNPNPQTELSL
jgi:hypothetical protein